MDRDLKRWQLLMAPVMACTMVAAAIFFAAVTVFQFSAVQDRIRDAAFVAAPLDLRKMANPTNFAEELSLANASARFQMEREVVARRHSSAALAFTSRLWTRFMGFLTGMLLAFVGAVFILGKLDNAGNELGAESQGISVSLKSTSPGIILAGLGTFLMALSIIVQANAKTYEGAIYLTDPSHPGQAAQGDSVSTDAMDEEFDEGSEPTPQATSFQGRNGPGDRQEEQFAMLELR